MSNFTFLTTDWPGLFVPAREAEQHVNSAPGARDVAGRGTLLAILLFKGEAPGSCNDTNSELPFLRHRLVICSTAGSPYQFCPCSRCGTKV
jgi:hypothetical protein